MPEELTQVQFPVSGDLNNSDVGQFNLVSNPETQNKCVAL